MTQDNVPRDIRDGTYRIEEGFSDDDDFELVEVLGNMVEEVADQGESDDDAVEELQGLLPSSHSTDDSIHSFSLHSGSVFACAMSPDCQMIVSGGEDDRLIVVSYPSGDIILDCKDYFQDSVIMVGFNHDGKYVFGCDMNGLLAVWKILPSGISQVFTETIGGLTASSWAKWHPKSNVLLIGGQSVWLYKIPSGQCKLVHEGLLETECGEFMTDGKRAVLGFDDGSVKVIDLATGGTTCKFESESTQLGNVVSIAVHPDNNLIAVGAVNSKLGIFKTQQPKTVAVLECNDIDNGPRNDDSDDDEGYPSSSEAALFISIDGMNVLVAGTDRAIHIWDYTRLMLRHKAPVSGGVTRMVWPQNSRNLYVGTRIGNIGICNALSGETVSSLEGHSGGILDIKLSSDNKLLVTAGDDGEVKVFDISQGPSVSQG